jgi:hypothetical protein
VGELLDSKAHARLVRGMIACDEREARVRGPFVHDEAGGVEMETVAVVLSVSQDQVDEFQAGFREHELPVWRDLEARGLLIGATLNRLDISSSPIEGAIQYLVVASFSTGEGHHAHDAHPGFKEWNAIADSFQVSEALAFGGETVFQLAGPDAESR